MMLQREREYMRDTGYKLSQLSITLIISVAGLYLGSKSWTMQHHMGHLVFSDPNDDSIMPYRDSTTVSTVNSDSHMAYIPYNMYLDLLLDHAAHEIKAVTVRLQIDVFGLRASKRRHDCARDSVFVPVVVVSFKGSRAQWYTAKQTLVRGDRHDPESLVRFDGCKGHFLPTKCQQKKMIGQNAGGVSGYLRMEPPGVVFLHKRLESLVIEELLPLDLERVHDSRKRPLHSRWRGHSIL